MNRPEPDISEPAATRVGRILRVGHRGAPGVAPANTMASFRAAFAAGCDWVECDCRPAADGCIVLSHDDQVTDCYGQVHPRCV